MKLVRIQSVKPLHDFVVKVNFTDETTREINLEPFLRGKIFESLRNNQQAFRAVKVDQQVGTIVWENGADIDPDVLYHELKPAWAEDFFDLCVAQKEESDAPTVSLSEMEKELEVTK